MTHSSLELHLPDQPATSLVSFLESHFQIRSDAESTERITLYDTFDWRLYRSGSLLRVRALQRRFVWTWCDLDGTVRQEIRQPAVPGLLGDLEHSELRRALRPVVSMRRLLPIVRLSYRTLPIRIVDDEEKTLVRLAWKRGDAVDLAAKPQTPRPMPSVLRLNGLRGYDKAFRRAEGALIEEYGCRPCTVDELRRALEASGSQRRPGDYTSKPRLELASEVPAATAARQIHRALFDTMLRNEAGLRRDDDSEFLHDFRVAVRRTRSALSQIKKVFPAQPLAHFRGEFSWLGSLTGPTRDLDVYLLKMDDYRKILPAEVAGNLDPLVGFLENKQRQEHKRLVAGLDSPRYRALVEDWRAFLDTPPPADEEEAANADRPIVDLANRRIWRLVRRVVKDGRHILQVASDPEAHAEALHDLRIECKKLRYCMEFFRSLYPASQIDPLIRAFKKLQDNLGDFNDYEVQRRKLAVFADEMMQRRSPSAGTFLAMGRLMEFLDQAQEQERLAFEARFLSFVEPKRLDTFKSLFASS